ncbi:MAG: PEP-CTERM sorting domain-containing protein [Planctomycetota bacterium]
MAGPASSLPVPEPAALGLLVLGLGTVLFRRRARRRA